jgi:hypothetical protein
MDLRFSNCKIKNGYIHNIKIYSVIHPKNTELNSAFRVLDKLCQQVKSMGYIMNMDLW